MIPVVRRTFCLLGDMLTPVRASAFSLSHSSSVAWEQTPAVARFHTASASELQATQELTGRNHSVTDRSVLVENGQSKAFPSRHDRPAARVGTWSHQLLEIDSCSDGRTALRHVIKVARVAIPIVHVEIPPASLQDDILLDLESE